MIFMITYVKDQVLWKNEYLLLKLIVYLIVDNTWKDHYLPFLKAG